MNAPSEKTEKAFRKLIGSASLLLILGLMISAAVLAASTASEPGLLSIYIGLALAFFSSLVLSMRPFVADVLGARGADSELSLIQAFKAMLGASILFILLGLLNEMRAFPWW